MRVFCFPKLIALEDAKYDPREAKSRPRDAQEPPKRGPREAKSRPREAKSRPREAQEPPKSSQEPPKGGPRGAQERPREAKSQPGEAKSHPREAKSRPREAKSHPKEAQESPGEPNRGPRKLQESAREQGKKLTAKSLRGAAGVAQRVDPAAPLPTGRELRRCRQPSASKLLKARVSLKRYSYQGVPTAAFRESAFRLGGVLVFGANCVFTTRPGGG